MTLKAVIGALRLSAANAVVLVAALLAFAVLPAADAFACGGETPASASDERALDKSPDHDREGPENDHHSCPHGHGHHAFGALPQGGDGSQSYAASRLKSVQAGENRLEGQSPGTPYHPPRISGQA